MGMRWGSFEGSGFGVQGSGFRVGGQRSEVGREWVELEAKWEVVLCESEMGLRLSNCWW
jgi:hypothetical protein